MSKHLKYILLPAEEKGWDLWQDTKDGLQYVKSVQAISKKTAGGKDMCIALPTQLVVTSPLVLPEAPIEALKGMASLQLEQSGLLKPGVDSWDLYSVDTEDSLHCAVSLLEESNSDQIGQLSRHASNTFDFSARFYQVGDLDAILCKKEQGRWTLVFYKNAKPFYAELLEELESVSSVLRPLLLEMEVRGISFAPERLIIEKDHDWMSHNDQEVHYLKNEVRLNVELVEKVKVLAHNEADLSLVPQAVSITRSKKSRTERFKLLALVGLCVYAIVCMLLYKQHKQRENQIQQARNEVEVFRPQWDEHQKDLNKINELDGVLTNRWPLASFEKIYSHLPSHQELRFQVVEIQSGSILVKGVSPNIKLINNFRPRVANDPYFRDFFWKMPPVVEDRKTKINSFTMEALMKGGE